MKEVLNASLFVTGAAIISIALGYPGVWKQPALDRGFTWEGETVQVSTNRMLYAQNRLGQALVDFTDYGPNEAKYRFRFRSAETDKRQTARTGMSGAIKWRPNSMSYERNPWVQAGPLWLMWSNAGPSVSTVYYHSNRTHVAVLNNAEFTAFDFGTGTLQPVCAGGRSAVSAYLNAGLYVVSVILSLVVLISYSSVGAWFSSRT